MSTMTNQFVVVFVVCSSFCIKFSLQVAHSSTEHILPIYPLIHPSIHPLIYSLTFSKILFRLNFHTPNRFIVFVMKWKLFSEQILCIWLRVRPLHFALYFLPVFLFLFFIYLSLSLSLSLSLFLFLFSFFLLKLLILMGGCWSLPLID